MLTPDKGLMPVVACFFFCSRLAPQMLLLLLYAICAVLLCSPCAGLPDTCPRVHLGKAEPSDTLYIGCVAKLGYKIMRFRPDCKALTVGFFCG
jgi:hypothetical protein